MNYPYPFFDEYAKLESLVIEGLVTKRKHPDFDLYIYNYSPKAQFLPRSQWSETLSRARGLVLDESGRQVARSFDKFWNYDESFVPPSGEACYVSPKIDGSLILVLQYEGKLIFATRGSFVSDQAKEAEKIYQEKYGFWPNLGETLVFEVIYPENRIVVDYGDMRDLHLLSAFDGDYEYRPDVLRLYVQEDDELKVNPTYFKNDFSKYIESAKIIKGERDEGWVLRCWPSNLRVKIKGEDYFRLHRLIFNTSQKTIWEMLKSGQSVEELAASCGHSQFATWIKETALTLQASHANLNSLVLSVWWHRPVGVSRKDFAAWAKQQSPSITPFMFALLDGKDISDMLWDFVHPKFPHQYKLEGE